jgi:hypothetical protein
MFDEEFTSNTHDNDGGKSSMPCAQKIAPPKLGMLQWWHKVRGREKWQNNVAFNMAFVMVHSKGTSKKKILRSIVCSRYILCCWEVSTNLSTSVQLVINCGEKNQVELTFLGYIVPKGKGHH